MRTSPSTRGFYPEDVSYPTLPADLVAISDNLYTELMVGTSTGNSIEWGIDGVPYLVPAPLPTPEEILATERMGMQPYARAFFAALTQFPTTGFLHMLDAYTQAVTSAKAADPYAPLVVWDQRVTQVLRVHPDMEAFRIQFGLSPGELDAIFRVAQVIEAGT